MLASQNFLKKMTGRLSEIGRLSPHALAGYQTLAVSGRKASRQPSRTTPSIGLEETAPSQTDGNISLHGTEVLSVTAGASARAAMFHATRVLKKQRCQAPFDRFYPQEVSHDR